VRTAVDHVEIVVLRALLTKAVKLLRESGRGFEANTIEYDAMAAHARLEALAARWQLEAGAGPGGVDEPATLGGPPTLEGPE
jgi:hypothetical protein